jgi:hypothetical protein
MAPAIDDRLDDLASIDNSIVDRIVNRIVDRPKSLRRLSIRGEESSGCQRTQRYCAVSCAAITPPRIRSVPARGAEAVNDPVRRITIRYTASAPRAV